MRFALILAFSTVVANFVLLHPSLESFRGKEDSYSLRNALILAAQMKSFSDKPFTEWVEKRILQRL